MEEFKFFKKPNISNSPLDGLSDEYMGMVIKRHLKNRYEQSLQFTCNRYIPSDVTNSFIRVESQSITNDTYHFKYFIKFEDSYAIEMYFSINFRELHRFLNE